MSPRFNKSPDSDAGREVGSDEHERTPRTTQRVTRYADPALADLDPSAPPTVPNEPELDWIPFPTHLLPEPLRTLVVEGAKSIHCDETFVAMPGLAVCAGAIGATRTAQIKRDWVVPSILWCVVVSPSGATKSVGRELVLAPLDARQKRALRDYEQELREFGPLEAEYERDLAQWKKNKKSEGLPPEEPEKPQPLEFITNDITIESLIRVLAANPRGVLFEADELATWFGSFGRYSQGSGDAQAWIKVHGAGSIKVNRVGLSKPLYVPRAAVSVSGTIQPEVLAKALSGEHTESGLAARLLMAEPPRGVKQWSDHEVSEQAQRDFADRLSELLDLAFKSDEQGNTFPMVLPISTAARRRMKEFVNEHGLEVFDREGGEAAALSKLEAYAVRLALVMQLIDNPEATEVSDDWLAAGIEMARWFGNEAARFYRGKSVTPQQREDRKLLVWIEARGGEVTAREVQQGRRSLKTADEAEAALSRLVAAGHGVWRDVESGKRGGRPTRRFQLASASTSTEPPKPSDFKGSVNVDSPGDSGNAIDGDGWETA